METKNFLGLDGLNHFWEKAKTWIINEITTKIAGIVLSSVPVGTVLQGLYAAAPTGFLLCNGQEVAIASFPKLYAVIGTLEECQSENEGMFKVPDLRECALVGAGQSTRAILDENGHSHDVYALGEFKDDQFQGHYHNRSKNFVERSGADDFFDYHSETASREDAGYNSLGKILEPITDGTNGTPRTGTTTHGKQIGVNYIIKY